MFGGWIYAGPLWCEFGFACGAGVTLIAVGLIAFVALALCWRRVLFRSIRRLLS